jgi:hypothetical protein
VWSLDDAVEIAIKWLCFLFILSSLLYYAWFVLIMYEYQYFENVFFSGQSVSMIQAMCTKQS